MDDFDDILKRQRDFTNELMRQQNDFTNKIIEQEIFKKPAPVVYYGDDNKSSGNFIPRLVFVALIFVIVFIVQENHRNKSGFYNETTRDQQILSLVAKINQIQSPVPQNILDKYNFRKDYVSEINCIDYSFVFASVFTDGNVAVLANKNHCWVMIGTMQLEPQNGDIINKNAGDYKKPYNVVHISSEDKELIRRQYGF